MGARRGDETDQQKSSCIRSIVPHLQRTGFSCLHCRRPFLSIVSEEQQHSFLALFSF